MQASSTVFTLYDENGLTTPAKNYLTFSGNVITLNTVSPNVIYPSYRVIQILAKVKGFETYYGFVNLPIQIWPASFVAASTTATTRTIACAN
jgi:hypothetical protein